jgi:carboxymethylenebutenolidase
MTQRQVDITTEDGTCRAWLSAPEGDGPWPGIIMYPDAGGIREAPLQMGERLSNLGYVVLVPDFYYRLGPYDEFDMKNLFSNPDEVNRLMSMYPTVNADMVERDGNAFVDFLTSQPETAGDAVGTTGYCMGGRMSLTAAGKLGDRVAAAASFHGGNIAKEDDPESPHHAADAITATVYVAGGIEDETFPDEQKERLEEALTGAGVTHTIETYPAHHGFAVPDNGSYDESAAERHWAAMENLFGSVLGS